MMCWKTGEFSRLTGVSVRALRYYDYSGLLKPLKPNAVRLYREDDLRVLLEILALKFLRFDLVTIKGILDGSLSIQQELIAKRNQVIEEIDSLIKVKKAIENIRKMSESAPLELVIKLIRVQKAAIHLKKRRIRKLFPRHLREKTKEYEKRIALIILRLDTFSPDTLLKMCDEILAQVHQDVPGLLSP